MIISNATKSLQVSYLTALGYLAMILEEEKNKHSCVRLGKIASSYRHQLANVYLNNIRFYKLKNCLTLIRSVYFSLINILFKIDFFL